MDERFKDSRLKTPKHDEVVMWCHKNIKKIASDYYDKNFKESNNEIIIEAQKRNIDISEFTESDPTIVKKIKWEKSIIVEKYKGKDIIGFLDMQAECCYKRPIIIESNCGGGRLGAPKPKRIENYTNRPTILNFEIKPFINSLGELFRQINKYKAHCYPGEQFIVVSPDDRFRKVILSQGYIFIKFPTMEISYPKES